MERDFLKDLGLSSDQIKKVMAQYGKDIQQFKADHDQITQVEANNKALQTQLSQRNDQLKDLQKQAADNADLKAKIGEAIAKNKEQAKQFKAQMAARDKQDAISNSLRDVGARNSKAVEALLDLDKVSLDDNGNLIGLNEQLESIKKSDGYLFNSEDKEKPKAPQIVAAGNPSEGPNKATIDLTKASYQDILKFKHDYPKEYERLEKKEE